MKFLILVMVSMVCFEPLLAQKFQSWEDHTIASVQSLEKRGNVTGAVVSVGSDNACDFRIGATKIQDAISSGASEIRIVRDTYNENLVIDDTDLTLIGGYDDCTDANNDVRGTLFSTVNANGVGTVLRVSGNARRYTVNIEKMSFRSGNGNSSSLGGGIFVDDADVQLNLNDVTVAGNSGISGGGLSIIDGNADVIGIDLYVTQNRADSGGGIYCSGANTSILMADGPLGFTGIRGNRAEGGNGGGVRLQNGCVFTTYAGTANGLIRIGGIAVNQATVSGGGIAVESGSIASLIGFEVCFFNRCFGNNDEPLNVDFNSADSDDNNTGNGGGIWVSGVGSSLDAKTVLINGNSAHDGGGVAVVNGANFSSNYIVKTCHEPDRCNQVIDNEANLGGAVLVGNGSQATIGNTHIQGNRANFGAVGYVLGTDSTLDIEGSIITANGDNGSGNFLDTDIFRINGVGSTNTQLILDFVTIADNLALSSVVSNLNASFELKASIVSDIDSGDVYFSSNPISQLFECLIVHEELSIMKAGGGTLVNVDDPIFIDPAGGNYRIDASTSPAVDYCNAFTILPTFNDIDLEPRGFDDPSIIDFSGPVDIGADETYANDIIFADEFE